MLPGWNRLRIPNSSKQKKKYGKNRKDPETFLKKSAMTLKTYYLSRKLEKNINELRGSRQDGLPKNTLKAITTTSNCPQV